MGLLRWLFLSAALTLTVNLVPWGRSQGGDYAEELQQVAYQWGSGVALTQVAWAGGVEAACAPPDVAGHAGIVMDADSRPGPRAEPLPWDARSRDGVNQALRRGMAQACTNAAFRLAGLALWLCYAAPWVAALLAEAVLMGARAEAQPSTRAALGSSWQSLRLVLSAATLLPALLLSPVAPPVVIYPLVPAALALALTVAAWRWSRLAFG